MAGVKRSAPRGLWTVAVLGLAACSPVGLPGSNPRSGVAGQTSAANDPLAKLEPPFLLGEPVRDGAPTRTTVGAASTQPPGEGAAEPAVAVATSALNDAPRPEGVPAERAVGGEAAAGPSSAPSPLAKAAQSAVALIGDAPTAFRAETEKPNALVAEKAVLITLPALGEAGRLAPTTVSNALSDEDPSRAATSQTVGGGPLTIRSAMRGRQPLSLRLIGADAPTAYRLPPEPASAAMAPGADGAVGARADLDGLRRALTVMIERQASLWGADRLVLGKSGEVSLLLPAQVAADLKAKAAEYGMTGADKGAVVSVALAGKGFRLDPARTQVRAIPSGQPLRFTWRATPTTSDGALVTRIGVRLGSSTGNAMLDLGEYETQVTFAQGPMSGTLLGAVGAALLGLASLVAYSLLRMRWPARSRPLALTQRKAARLPRSGAKAALQPKSGVGAAVPLPRGKPLESSPA